MPRSMWKGAISFGLVTIPVAVSPVAVGPVGAVPPPSTSVSPLEQAENSTIAKIEAAGKRLRACRTSEFVYRTG